MLWDRALVADFTAIKPRDLITLTPLAYFNGDLKTCITSSRWDHNELYILNNLYTLLERIMLLPLTQLWQEIKKENLHSYDDTPFSFTTHNYESQSTVGKVRTVIRFLNHISCAPHKAKCSLESCCELVESEGIQPEVLVILCCLIQNVFHIDILPEFICGYIIHCNSVNVEFLQKLLLNFPSKLPLVIDKLWHFNGSYKKSYSNRYECSISEVTCDSKSTENPIGSLLVSIRIQQVLYSSLCINPQNAFTIAEKCIASCQFPSLLLEILLNVLNREFYLLIILKRILLDSGSKTRLWMSEFLKEATSIAYIDKLTKYFISATNSIISSDDCIPLGNDAIINAMTLLRVLAAFRGFVGYNFPAELSRQLLRLLTHRTVMSERGSQYISYALAFLIGLHSSLTGSNQINSIETGHCTSTAGLWDIENTIVTWLQRLINEQCSIPIQQNNANQMQFRKIPSYIESLLLLAILFHTNQPGPITELISNLLGLRIPSLGRTVHGWRKLFLQTVFTENMISSQIGQLPITSRLNRDCVSQLAPVQCMLQLLKSNAFIKHQLRTKEWIINQVNACIRPLYALMPDLLEAHIMHSSGAHTKTPTNQSVGTNISDLITEYELIQLFTTNFQFAQYCAPAFSSHCDMNCQHTSSSYWFMQEEQDLTPQLLFLYYTLFVYDYQFSMRMVANRQNQAGDMSCVYSDKLWESIPITYLLHHARKYLSDYRPLYPKLLQLVTNHFPHLVVGEMMIQDELLLDPLWMSEQVQFADQSLIESPIGCDQLLRHTLPTYHHSTSITPHQLNQAFIDVLTASTGHALVASESEYIKWKNLILLIGRLIQVNNENCLLEFATVLAVNCPKLLINPNAADNNWTNVILSGNRQFVQQLELLWRRLHLIMPRRLELVTINALAKATASNDTSAFELKSVFPGMKSSQKKFLNGLDLCVNPVENILTCVHRSVFRCPSMLCLLLRILESNLLASRSYWSHRLVDRLATTGSKEATLSNDNHLCSVTKIASYMKPTCQINVSTNANGATSVNDSKRSLYQLNNGRLPSTTNVIPLATNQTNNTAITNSNNSTSNNSEECDRVCVNMLLTQDATVIQLLLEYCLETEDEKRLKSDISVLRECRNIICAFIHSMFIAEPLLVEIIVNQTYPRSLIPTSVQAIPSLHICLDSVIDVFRLCGDVTKMVFCFDLVSHLAQHYNIQATADRAAFMIDALYHILIFVITGEERTKLLFDCLPAFLRISRAFPNLAPTIARCLMTVGVLICHARSSESQLTLSGSLSSPVDIHESGVLFRFGFASCTALQYPSHR